ncbi:uncharacterized protein RCC_02469 [Ramularia collo-cygni]|uniref:Zn(2)-C6 fungal-type domain-containing protein n=1 Tax=Ramularia collo-cygni TaxID=112498 RepID=A0A2D3V2C1_9PEZI|nr:uncharacterized protein RCC_02469 [Ramularia collo-cygni]CZT16634.1 uncharacterized protein RCC_02469 [Ramularia collo-cygni]
MSLPPIQHFDPPAPSMQSQPRQYIAATLSNGAAGQSHHPSPYPTEYQYQSAPPVQHMANNQQVQIQAANGQSNGAMRYPIQPQTPSERQISGGRHKKEIKRRTKTGCLTCRKRRIKCDEGHPTCRNCQKSKRECLGYDPIFKQTPIQPANIQPLPPHHPQHPQHIQHQQQQQQHQQQQQLHPQPQPQQHQQQHQQHQQQHQLQSQQRPVQQQQYHQQPPPHEGGPVPSSLPSNPYQTPPYPSAGAPFASAQPRGPDSSYGYSSPLDPELSTRSPQLSRMAHSSNYPAALQPQRNVKQLRIDDLFAINDVPPRFQLREAPPPVTSTTQEQIGQFYKFNYAQGLDRLFETGWYSRQGPAYLNYHPVLQDFITQVIEQMSAKEDVDNNAIISLEARLVWQLACLPRHAATYCTNGEMDPPLAELLPRVDSLECLMTGQFLDPNKVSPSPQAQTPSTPAQDSSAVNQKYNERSFWHHLSKFVSYRDDQTSGLQGVNESLAVIRGILAMLENRDVLYSIAIARHIGGRLPSFDPQRHISASNNDVADDLNKLKVAHQFVENEEQRGTSQVIQRICSMSMRSWKLQKQ